MWTWPALVVTNTRLLVPVAVATVIGGQAEDPQGAGAEAGQLRQTAK
jgi:hypothetical protein